MFLGNGAKIVGDALDVGGTGNVADASIKGLKKLGLELMPDVASRAAESVTGVLATGMFENVAAKTPISSEVFLSTYSGW